MKKNCNLLTLFLTFSFIPLLAMHEKGEPESGLRRSISDPELTRIDSFLKSTCAVCLEPFKSNESIRILECGHPFHEKCADEWVTANQKCPYCRGVTHPKELKETEFSVVPLTRDDKDSLDRKATFSHIASLWKKNCLLCNRDLSGQDRIISDCPYDHAFHTECIKAWRKNHDGCPTCHKQKFKMIKEGDKAERRLPLASMPAAPRPGIPLVHSRDSMDLAQQRLEVIERYLRNFQMAGFQRVQRPIPPLPRHPVQQPEPERRRSCSLCHPLCACLLACKNLISDCGTCLSTCLNEKCSTCYRKCEPACSAWKDDCDVSPFLINSDDDQCGWECPLNTCIRCAWVTAGPPSLPCPDCLLARCCCKESLESDTSAKVAAVRSLLCCAGSCGLCYFLCNIHPYYWLSLLGKLD